MQHGVQLKSLFARAKSQQAATAVGSCQAAATQSPALLLFFKRKSLCRCWLLLLQRWQINFLRQWPHFFTVANSPEGPVGRVARFLDREKVARCIARTQIAAAQSLGEK
jgi:hypothetical protein